MKSGKKTENKICGILKVDGEDVFYTFRRTYRMPNQEWNYTIQATYKGESIDIDDHGGGLQYATALLQNNIIVKKELRGSPKSMS